MIDTLQIANFKCFSGLRLTIKPLTLLTGLNAGGKTTSLQPLLLMTQALKGNWDSPSLALNGPLLRLGTAGDVLPRGANNSAMSLRIESGGDALEWDLEAKAGMRALIVQKARQKIAGTKQHQEWVGGVAPIGVSATPLLKVLSSLSYVSAARGELGEVFPFPDSEPEWPDVGVLGQYAAYWLNQTADDELEAPLRSSAEPATSIRKQLDAYFSELFAGAQANVIALLQSSALGLQFKLEEESGWQRPANIGYGLSYAFPILVSLLTSRPGQILVFDSPEAHLHPMAQSRMGMILAAFAAGGRRVIVETHSDHLLNGARLAVANGSTKSDDVAIHFFAGASATNNGVTSPSIDKAGNIDAWPDGFFDQSEKDLAQLAGWS